MNVLEPTHLLKENGAKEAPFADFTLCGLRVTDVTLAMWPGDTLAEHHIRGRWCPSCKEISRQYEREEWPGKAGQANNDAIVDREHRRPFEMETERHA